MHTKSKEKGRKAINNRRRLNRIKLYFLRGEEAENSFGWGKS